MPQTPTEFEAPAWLRPVMKRLVLATDAAVEDVVDGMELEFVNSFVDEPLSPRQTGELGDIAEMAVRLRQRLVTLETAREQVHFCLGQFRAQMADVDQTLPLRSRVVYTIAERWGDAHWSEAQRSYFADAARELRSSYDYFLSFSRRGAGDDVVMRINRENEELIDTVLSADAIKRLENRENLVARTLHELLRERRLHGFYFPDFEWDNAVITEKITPALARSRVFVQVLQMEMFSGLPDRNVCFLEFRGAGKRRAYVHADPANQRPDESDVALDYSVWYREVFLSQLDIPDLVPKTPGLPPGREVADRLGASIGSVVQDAKKALMAGAPE